MEVTKNRMIKNILYVEDGSVDVDELAESFGDETKIIVYRQGAKPPILEQPKEPIKNYSDDLLGQVCKETALKFAEKLKSDISEDNELFEVLNIYLKRDYIKYIDEICNQIVEEVTKCQKK